MAPRVPGRESRQMDIPRKFSARKRLIRRLLVGVIVLGAIPLITYGLSRLKPAAPSVERSTVWLDTVKRGPMLREVRGLGTLVPEEVLWIPATTDGRVERVLLKPGTAVEPETLLLELSNPQLDLDALDAEFQLKASEAAYTDLRVKLESQRLDQQAGAARVQAEYNMARIQADTDEQMVKEGLTPDLTLKLSQVRVEELANRYRIEQKRLDISTESVEAQLAAQKVQVEQRRALSQLRRSQVEQLKVRAGTRGVLQQLPVEVGQRVIPGATLAKVVQPWRLKADVKIAETQAKDILLGQKASIDTRNGIIPGRVVRIDPAVVNGTVTVDIALEGALPQGARPDLAVDGTIELERLTDVLYVGRPVFGQPNSLVGLFKLQEDGTTAARVQVKLGRSSVNTIEILEGLKVGDQVLLSDMSAWDAYDRLRLN